MRRVTVDADAVRERISGNTLTIGITAYNAGDGLLPTVESVWQGLSQLNLTDSQMLLSESFDQPALSSAPSVSAWSERVGARLAIDSADHRRSLKEALNVLFGRADSDVLIVVVDDVVVPLPSLIAMLHCLFADPRPVAAIGATQPDPAFSGMRRRAGAWQLRSVTRAASLAPRLISANSFRAEGAFWGAWRVFYGAYRLPLGSGSIHDDVEVTRALVSGGYDCRSVPDAFVYKVPAGSFADLCSGTVRSRIAQPDHTRSRYEFAAAIIETVRDPVGAFLYAVARAWCLGRMTRFASDSSELWRVLSTTKRPKNDA